MLLWAMITDTYVVTDFDIHHHFSYHTHKHNSNKCAQKLVFKVKRSTTSVSILSPTRLLQSVTPLHHSLPHLTPLPLLPPLPPPLLPPLLPPLPLPLPPHLVWAE